MFDVSTCLPYYTPWCWSNFVWSMVGQWKDARGVRYVEAWSQCFQFEDGLPDPSAQDLRTIPWEVFQCWLPWQTSPLPKGGTGFGGASGTKVWRCKAGTPEAAVRDETQWQVCCADRGASALETGWQGRAWGDGWGIWESQLGEGDPANQNNMTIFVGFYMQWMGYSCMGFWKQVW